MNFYKHFIGDYGRDTGHLTLVEHGAYRTMLDSFYGTGRPLPSEKRALYRLLRAESDLEKKAVDAVSLRFWRPLPETLQTLFDMLDLQTEDERAPLRTVAIDWTESEGLINVRALCEIVKAHVISGKNRKTAIEREQRRRVKAEGQS